MNQNLVKARLFSLRPRRETVKTGKAAQIMLVEDNPADVGLVIRALEEHDVAGNVRIFGDGESAIDFIASLDDHPQQCPDLIIIDLNLPRRPGREVLECFTQNSWCHAKPAVVLSSSEAQQDRADAARLGARTYLRKPSRLQEFLALGAILKDLLTQSDQ